MCREMLVDDEVEVEGVEEVGDGVEAVEGVQEEGVGGEQGEGEGGEEGDDEEAI